MDIIKLLSIQKEDKNKWVKYYELETYKYYDYILNIIPNNQNILEIGSGGGVFYSKHENILTKRNNKYTCIDIDKQSIQYSKNKCNYVDFYVKDICDFTEKELKSFDLLLLVQSYIQIQNIENVFERYFKANPNGCIMMINTIFPNVLSDVATICKTHILPIILNNNCVSGKALTLNEIEKLGTLLDRKITNINIGKSLSSFDEYLTIIR
jgi:2-polyprenyl-3-methyl-5-hydroxy-6-metoxy-1,4-benzoquinol methylase